MASAPPPRREAALVAQALTRAELERAGENVPESESDAEDWVDEEEALGGGEEQALVEVERGQGHGPSTMARKRAEEAWAAMNAAQAPPPARSAILARLHHDFKAPKKARTGGDPMLAALLKADHKTSAVVAVAAAAAASTASEAAQRAAQDALLTTGKTRVEEQVRFGGQMVSISRRIQTKQAILENEQAAKQTGLDKLVSGLQGRKGISTVVKSSADWDAYKHENNLEEELVDASKTGLVEKSDFLSRVDERQFEIERAQRERERTQREAASSMRAGMLP